VQVVRSGSRMDPDHDRLPSRLAWARGRRQRTVALADSVVLALLG
jgi:hypothetical protein